MIKGAIFDIDGVVLDSMKMWNHLGSRYLESLDIMPEEGLNDILFSMSMEEGAHYLKTHYPLDQSEQDIIEDIKLMITSFYVREVQAKKGVKALLDYLRSKTISIVVATSSDCELVKQAIKRNGLANYFERIMSTSEIGKSKHVPDIYNCLACYLKCSPSEILVFEDSLYALQTAKKAGFITVGVYDAFGEKQQDELRKNAHYYMKDYSMFNELKEGRK